MSYKHKSGAQKRKEKDERDNEAKKGQLSLGQYFKPSTASTELPIRSIVKSSQVSNELEGKGNNVIIIDSNSTNLSMVIHTNEDNIITETDNVTIVTEKSLSSPRLQPLYKYFDIGDPNFDIDRDLKYPHIPNPESFPVDSEGFSVPISIFKKKLTNNEMITRDWLVWSKVKQAFYCLPCKLFSTLPESQRSALALPEGFSTAKRWKKLYDKVPEHENSSVHKKSYVQWKSEIFKIKKDKSLSGILLKSINSDKEKWRELLKRLIKVTLFLAERGLAFRGDSEKIGESSNGNFLGILELLANYDPVLNEHLNKIRHFQEKGDRMQVHYLSHDIQNEFISLCAAEVTKKILEEREKARYYSVIVDATPDSAHVEQTVILIRYVNLTEQVENQQYQVEERLLCFVDCANKSGKAIADLIMSKLKIFKIPLEYCKGQGYDNGSNMKGVYKGAQVIILRANNEAIYSACTCHSLNLCGEQAAESCTAAFTFFGVIQKLYNIISSSPQRWEILKKKIPSSLHSMLRSRWSARVDSVKPVAAHLPAILETLEDLKLPNLTSECRRDIQGLEKYFKTFNCLLLASIWFKILKSIDIVNRVLQCKSGTLDVASKNLSSLIEDLHKIRNEGYDNILNETLIVAKNIGWPQYFEEELKRTRKRKRHIDEDDENENADDHQRTKFKNDVFNIILDSVIGDMTVRFESVHSLCERFSVLWLNKEMTIDQIQEKTTRLVKQYPKDLGDELTDELQSLKLIYSANFGEKTLSPWDLLNAIKTSNLEN